jgi:hypothetical protein
MSLHAQKGFCIDPIGCLTFCNPALAIHSICVRQKRHLFRSGFLAAAVVVPMLVTHL